MTDVYLHQPLDLSVTIVDTNQTKTTGFSSKLSAIVISNLGQHFYVHQTTSDHFPSLKRIKTLKCIYCFDEMTQIHCTICPGRSEMRSGLDMNNLDDLVTYFQRFLSEEAKKTTT